jgi:hypothetical protein
MTNATAEPTPLPIRALYTVADGSCERPVSRVETGL